MAYVTVVVASKNARTRAMMILDPFVGDLFFHIQKLIGSSLCPSILQF